METTRNLSSGLLHTVRWPVVLFAAAIGLVPHILLLNHSATERLTMILVMHAMIVPSFTLAALAALERRARTLETANVELHRTAANLARRNRQHNALSEAVRLLSAAPSVAGVLVPLADLAKQIAQADWLRLTWAAPGADPRQVLACAPGRTPPEPTATGRVTALREGGVELGRLEMSGSAPDDFTETSLSLLTSEVGLRWRLRQVETNALSAIYAAGDGLPGFEAPRQTRKLLQIMCEAVGADSASLYLRRGGNWQRREQFGPASEVDMAHFDAAGGLRQTDDGATLCVEGTRDGVLVLHRSDGQPVDTGLLSPALMQIIAGHSATLMRVIDSCQEMLWAERRRIARELHDDVCQSIASVHMQLGHLQTLIAENRSSAGARCEQLRMAALAAYEASRAAVDGLHQTPAPEESSAGYLERIARTACDRCDVSLEWKAEKIHLDAEATWQLGRVIQEAVTNASRHGGAETIRVSLENGSNGIGLTISDDGSFSPIPENGPDTDGHYGLQIMQERVAGLHGRFSIGRKDGLTTVQISLLSD